MQYPFLGMYAQQEPAFCGLSAFSLLRQPAGGEGFSGKMSGICTEKGQTVTAYEFTYLRFAGEFPVGSAVGRSRVAVSSDLSAGKRIRTPHVKGMLSPQEGICRDCTRRSEENEFL